MREVADKWIDIKWSGHIVTLPTVFHPYIIIIERDNHLLVFTDIHDVHIKIGGIIILQY